MSFSAGDGDGPATCDYIDYSPIGASVPIGDAAADRRVFFFLHAVRNGPIALNSVTVGGVAGTIHGQRNTVVFSSARTLIALCSAYVPSGTTTAVSADYTNTPAGTPNLAVYRVTGLSGESAISLVATDKSDDDWNHNLNVFEGGFVLASLFSYGNPSRVVSCSQMIKDVEQGNGENIKAIAWSSLEETTQAGKTFSWVTSGGQQNVGPFVAATFR